jgi:hypothetical protein
MQASPLSARDGAGLSDGTLGSSQSVPGCSINQYQIAPHSIIIRALHHLHWPAVRNPRFRLVVNHCQLNLCLHRNREFIVIYNDIYRYEHFYRIKGNNTFTKFFSLSPTREQASISAEARIVEVATFHFYYSRRSPSEGVNFALLMSSVRKVPDSAKPVG